MRGCMQLKTLLRECDQTFFIETARVVLNSTQLWPPHHTISENRPISGKSLFLLVLEIRIKVGKVKFRP